MIQGLYTAAGGMLAVESRQFSIANNIANAATTGYKRQSPVQLGFYQVFSQSLRRPFHFDIEAAPAGGVKVVETYPDLNGGVLRTTENPLHVALQGPGFFVLDTPRGPRYTRAGDFTADQAGNLATQNGHVVQSVTGHSISVRGGTVIIDREGRVSVDGAPTGQIRVVEFDAPHRLMREGESLYAASDTAAVGMAAAANTIVEQNQLEMSNVNLPREMTMMLLGMRAYEANQRVIQAFDATMGRLIESVGMPL